MQKILFEFQCRENWHIDAFEAVVKERLKDKGEYRLLPQATTYGDDITQDYIFIAEEPGLFFFLGMVLSLVYACIDDGTISKRFKPATK